MIPDSYRYIIHFFAEFVNVYHSDFLMDFISEEKKEGIFFVFLKKILENPADLWYTKVCETGYGIWPYYPGS